MPPFETDGIEIKAGKIRKGRWAPSPQKGVKSHSSTKVGATRAKMAIKERGANPKEGNKK